MYQQHIALPDDFELMIQGEIPKRTDVMRELDFCNDQHVIFMVVLKENIIELD